MKIEVTQEDINEGVHGSACRCPVALAIKRATGSRTVAVAGVFVFLVKPGKTLQLPSSVFDFIDDFDHNKEVDPFEFELNL